MIDIVTGSASELVISYVYTDLMLQQRCEAKIGWSDIFESKYRKFRSGHDVEVDKNCPQVQPQPQLPYLEHLEINLSADTRIWTCCKFRNLTEVIEEVVGVFN